MAVTASRFLGSTTSSNVWLSWNSQRGKNQQAHKGEQAGSSKHTKVNKLRAVDERCKGVAGWAILQSKPGKQQRPGVTSGVKRNRLWSQYDLGRSNLQNLCMNVDSAFETNEGERDN